MKKDFIIKGILIPLSIGVVLGIAFFLYWGLSKQVVMSPKAAVSYFDSTEDSSSNVSSLNVVDFSSNEKIGTLSFGSEKLDIRYNSDYSNLVDSISLTNGSAFGQAGYGYYLVFENNIKNLNKEEITISSSIGDYSYKYKKTISASNENDVLLSNVGDGSGIILYYQKANSYGFTSQYEALVYEEV